MFHQPFRYTNGVILMMAKCRIHRTGYIIPDIKFFQTNGTTGNGTIRRIICGFRHIIWIVNVDAVVVVNGQFFQNRVHVKFSIIFVVVSDTSFTI